MSEGLTSDDFYRMNNIRILLESENAQLKQRLANTESERDKARVDSATVTAVARALYASLDWEQQERAEQRWPWLADEAKGGRDE